MMRTTLTGPSIDSISSRIQAMSTQNIVVLERLALTSKFFIEERLASVLGDDKRHFSVSVLPLGNSIKLQVAPVNELGKYIYYGTKPHSISSGVPMPIGSGLFAHRVYHPGTKSRKEEIDDAIKAGYMMAFAVVFNK